MTPKKTASRARSNNEPLASAPAPSAGMPQQNVPSRSTTKKRATTKSRGKTTSRSRASSAAPAMEARQLTAPQATTITGILIDCYDHTQSLSQNRERLRGELNTIIAALVEPRRPGGV